MLKKYQTDRHRASTGNIMSPCCQLGQSHNFIQLRQSYIILWFSSWICQASLHIMLILKNTFSVIMSHITYFCNNSNFSSISAPVCSSKLSLSTRFPNKNSMYVACLILVLFSGPF